MSVSVENKMDQMSQQLRQLMNLSSNCKCNHSYNGFSLLFICQGDNCKKAVVSGSAIVMISNKLSTDGVILNSI
jgi:hypothetical protein